MKHLPEEKFYAFSGMSALSSSAKEQENGFHSEKESFMEKIEKEGFIYSAIGAVFWGLSGTCSQYLFAHASLDASWLTCVRMTGAGILLLGILFAAGFVVPQSAVPFSSRKHGIAGILFSEDLFPLILFAIAGFLLCQYSYLSAIQYSNSGTATVLQNLSIAFITLIVDIRTKTRPDRKQIFCILLALAGVFLIATNGNPAGMVISPKGLFWGMGAALGVVSYTLLSEKLVKKWGSALISGYGFLIGGIVLCIAARVWTVRVTLDLTDILMIAVIIVFGTVGAFTLFMQGISRIGPVKATLIGCLEPVTATVLAVVWLHSVFTAADILGFICILTTVFLFTVEKSK